ncbi:MAG TPA: hypothetical protein VMH24_04250, partial [Candidatus Sulfotelmatobacter sp.]|nr:hypothetical protein [Candidatus Sulfotelmatobacter sp.]
MERHERLGVGTPVAQHAATDASARTGSARRFGRRGAAALLFLILSAALVGAAPVAGATGIPAPFFQRITTPWSGSVELYRASAFTTQPNSYTCVPTAVQIMLNLINGTSSHSTSQITAWYTWGRAHNAYTYAAAGLDPTSWSGLLTTFGPTPYQDQSYTTFDDALRAAVLAMRETGLPVGLLVDHAHHAWVMTGFAATADPLRSPFNVTSVTVMGPLYPHTS